MPPTQSLAILRMTRTAPPRWGGSRIRPRARWELFARPTCGEQGQGRKQASQAKLVLNPFYKP
jgi:hypothetical protein